MIPYRGQPRNLIYILVLTFDVYFSRDVLDAIMVLIDSSSTISARQKFFFLFLGGLFRCC